MWEYYTLFPFLLFCLPFFRESNKSPLIFPIPFNLFYCDALLGRETFYSDALISLPKLGKLKLKQKNEKNTHKYNINTPNNRRIPIPNGIYF